jgi:lipoate-protein ligase A
VHVAGRKIGGTGSAGIGGAAIVVGSFMLDFDRKAMASVLKVPSEKMRDKVAKALGEYMVTMRDLLPKVPSREVILATYVRRCEEALGRRVVAGELTGAELEEAEALDALLVSARWLEQRGGSARPEVKIHEDVHVVEADHKAPGGLIRVTARLYGDIIDDLELSGDFTLEPSTGLGVLEEALLGRRLDPAVVEETISTAYEAASLRSPGVTPADIAAAVLRLKH